MEYEYLNLLQHVLYTGTRTSNRTGVDTLSVFGHQMRCNLQKGFPLLTTKRLHTSSIFRELLWFISGDTNEQTLSRSKVYIWKEWATAEQCAKFGRKRGDLGPIYGHQWRNFGASKDGNVYRRDGFDQLSHVVDEIKRNPESRRLIVTGWNPVEAQDVALPPCHTLFQFYVQGGKLSCQLYQRSADVFLGVPYNIASYALLTHIVAQHVGLQVGDFVHTFGDVHLYVNHINQAETQLSRQPKVLPHMEVSPRPTIFDHKYEDFQLTGYDPYPKIKAEVAV